MNLGRNWEKVFTMLKYNINIQNTVMLLFIYFKGSFGEVREATHQITREKRAVKIIKKNLLSSKSELDAEFNILRNLVYK